jgi:hypothetical protein
VLLWKQLNKTTAKTMSNQFIKSTLSALIITSQLSTAFGAELEANLSIENHEFFPKTLKIPANTKVKLNITNLDSSAEEFESHSLNREKVIPGKTKAVIYIGPLNPGQYSYFGEFNPKTAQGVIIAE